MPQVSLYVDEELMRTLRADARAEGVSLSKYVAGVLARSKEPAYPAGFFELYGRLAEVDLKRPEDPAPAPLEPLR